jgi:hypothetical protein
MSIFNKKINDKVYHYRGVEKTKKAAIDKCERIRKAGYESTFTKSKSKVINGYIIWGR